eukprot:TRINITY_DN38785_c0_g1_i1.p1 TRINITY_DN38785_c0_g1~~TRINITY_DN38785_c0_g1_i1.p1  ORF type:complete len:276 (+),score=56.46 TRINITY_DN38785_c0_g1_i1:77-904(+)
MSALWSCMRRAWILVVVPRRALGNGEDEDEADQIDPETFDAADDVLSVKQLRGLHGHMDMDGDGELSLSEVLLYAESIGQRLALNDVDVVFAEVDSSKDGKVDLVEHMLDMHTFDNASLELEIMKFEAADVNKDRHLEKHEFIRLLYMEMQGEVLSVVTKDTMRMRDKDGNGMLTPVEFWQAHETFGKGVDVSEEDMADFKALDANSDGLISLEELRLWESGKFYTQRAMKRMFKVADRDANARLSADELANARDELYFEDAQYNLLQWAAHHEL